MKCVIISAGEISDYNEMKKYINADDYIVAADGGYRHLEPFGVKCDYFLGDFDSIGEIPEGADEIYPSEKDDTDTMLAIKHGLLKGMDEFVILGGLGGRLDHTIANISSLEYMKSHGASGVLADETTIVRLFGTGDKVRPMMAGEYFSIFPFGVSSAVVSISGVQYPLSRHVMHSDFPLGVSNTVTDPDNFSLTIHEGKILVVECKKD
ncbi:MAG: thiamine diphosphokinase [Firmicutes bacterium]|nr:thiamine diphosphokinase [Bacillota bacterium]